MCIIAVAYRAHSHWPLVVAANRDELHQRASEPLKAWDTNPLVIAGRDRVAGGTWLGVSEDGHFAAVSNVRSAPQVPPTGLSRGKLVVDFLLGAALPAEGEAALFNPFNMIAIGGEGARFLSNRPKPRRARVSAGVHAFSNGAFDDEWPKTRRLKDAIRARLRDDALTPETLFELLYADARPSQGATAVEEAIFVRNAAYGTRCSTVVMVDRGGEGRITERRFDRDGQMTGETALPFGWPKAALWFPGRSHP